MKFIFYPILFLLICCSKKATAPSTNIIYTYEQKSGIHANPCKGFAPTIEAVEELENTGLTIPVNLVYKSFTWAQIEPNAQGEIDWEAIEKNFTPQINKGRMIGLRFKLVDPGIGGILDIPQWLSDLGVSTSTYTIDGQSGLVPDWDNPILLDQHDRIIKELAARYNNHPDIAWVDIGSYGIWGEWHHYENEQLAAKFESSKNKILESYFTYFTNKLLVIPYNDSFATLKTLNNGDGLRNDCLGPSDSNNWFYSFVQNLVPDIWSNTRKYPLISGEFCNGDDGAFLQLSNNLDDTLKYISQTKWSFIGPAGGRFVIETGATLEKAKTLYQKLGYDFFIHSLTINKAKFSPGDLIKGTLSVRNSGSSIFPLPWPVKVKIGNIIFTLSMDIRQWTPGINTSEFSIQLPTNIQLLDNSITLYIADPAVPKRKIIFSNSKQLDGNVILQ